MRHYVHVGRHPTEQLRRTVDTEVEPPARLVPREVGLSDAERTRTRMRLDADHLRAQVGKVPRRERQGDRLFHGQDPDALEWSIHRCSLPAARI